MPGLPKGHGEFVRQAGDQLRLATTVNVNKNQVVYLSQNADHRQATDDLLKTWFRTTSQGQEYNVFVIVERQEKQFDNPPYDEFVQDPSKVKKENEEKTKPVIQKEKKDKRKRTSVVKEEKTEPFIQDISNVETFESQSASRKRSFSDLSVISEALPSPDELLQPAGPYRTRRRHVLDEEDTARIAQFD